MKRYYIEKSELENTIKAINTQQNKKNVFVNVEVKGSKNGKLVVKVG